MHSRQLASKATKQELVDLLNIAIAVGVPTTPSGTNSNTKRKGFVLSIICVLMLSAVVADLKVHI